ncbi:MAG: hypothetical protein HDQ88_03200, partial [Clostridia bacterium]|nr:hypothetical protein [Clostridia bacterium]
MSDIGLGFSGITVAGFNGSVADKEGLVRKALFAITYAERLNDVNVSFTQGSSDWCAIDPYDESIGMRNPRVLSANRYGAVVEFDLDEGYPSDSLLELGKRSPSANWTITELDADKPFTPNTLTTV